MKRLLVFVSLLLSLVSFAKPELQDLSQLSQEDQEIIKKIEWKNVTVGGQTYVGVGIEVYNSTSMNTYKDVFSAKVTFLTRNKDKVWSIHKEEKKFDIIQKGKSEVQLGICGKYTDFKSNNGGSDTPQSMYIEIYYKNIIIVKWITKIVSQAPKEWWHDDKIEKW